MQHFGLECKGGVGGGAAAAREAGNWIWVEEIVANAGARRAAGGRAREPSARLLRKVAPRIIPCCKNLIAGSFLITVSSASSFSKSNHVSVLVKSESVSNERSASAAGVSCKHTTACAAAAAKTGESSDTMGFSLSRCWNNAERSNLCKGEIQKQATKYW